MYFKAPSIGGRFSVSHWYFENMNQHSFANVLISFKFSLYNKKTNISRTSSVTKLGKFYFPPNFENDCKIILLEPRNAFQQAVFDLLLNPLVWLQPVNTWNVTKDLHLSGPKASKHLLMLISLLFSPFSVLKIDAYSRIKGESTILYLKLSIKRTKSFLWKINIQLEP